MIKRSYIAAAIGMMVGVAAASFIILPMGDMMEPSVLAMLKRVFFIILTAIFTLMAVALEGMI